MRYRSGSCRRRSRLGASWTTKSRSQSSDRHRVRPELLELEERRLLATFTVSSTADDGSAGTLRSAIAEVNGTPGNNTIQFDPTVFHSIQTITLTASQLELSNTAGTQTIIGPAAGVIVSGGNLTRVLKVDNGVTTSISGLTFTQGNASAPGAGLYNLGNSTLTDCTISGNVSTRGGGGMFNAGTASLTGCYISGNSGRYGGGLDNGGGTITLADSTISFNGGVYGGGGIEITQGTATLTSCTISDNGYRDGGGVVNNATVTLADCVIQNNIGGGVDNNGTATLTDCTITGNQAIGGGAVQTSGGGMANSGTANLSNCTLSDNSVSTSGGGLSTFNGTTNLTDCTISGNSAQRGGGGLDLVQGKAYLTDCTIDGNAATVYGGGGVATLNSAVYLANCTISGNTDSASGGGLFNQGTMNLTACTVSGNAAPSAGGGLFNNGTANLIDTIVAGNTTLPTSLIASDIAGGPSVSGSFNLIGTGGSDGLQNGSSGNIVLPSLSTLGLAPLGYYGGPTETMPLLPGSAAIAKGTLANYPGTNTSITTDERGEPNDLPPSIGAFQVEPGLVVDTTADGQGSPSGKLSLRQVFNLANANDVAATITFDPTVFATTQTVTLTQGSLELSSTGGTLTIDGPTAGLIVSGGGVSQAFVLNVGAAASITGLTITDGASGVDGGGLYNNGTLTLTDCTISGNSAKSNGGGLYSPGMINLSNCTISNNSAGDGGGLDISGTANLTDCTISGNAASVRGGGLDDTGTVTLENTIVAGNTGGSDSASDIYGTIAGSSSYNLIGIGGSGGLTNGIGNNIVLSSLAGLGLAALGNYGGPTETMALLPGSVAVGAGTGESGVTTDQRGAPRPTSGAVDIGAFQDQGYTAAVSSGSPQGTLIGQAFNAPLVALLTENFASAPLLGATIDFSAPSSGASATLSAGSAVTDASGLATVTATANATDGAYIVTASAAGVTSSASFNLTNRVRPVFSGLIDQTVTYGGSVTFTGALAAGGVVPPAGEKVNVTVDGVTKPATIGSNGSFSTQFTRADGVIDASSTAYNVTYAYVTDGVFLAADGSSQLTVNREALTITAVSDTKVYDGTTSASASAAPTITSGSLATGDTPDFTETYSTRNVGTGLTLTPRGTVNDGNGGNNYAYTFVAMSTGVITLEALTITAATNTKVYDGTTSAAAVPMITSGNLSTGDTAEFTETYNTRNVGRGITLTPSGTVNDGNGGNNYTFTFVATSTGVIAARALTITAVANTKVYDGTMGATAVPLITSGSLVTGDPANFTETYNTRNGGTHLTLTPSGTVNDGNGGKNYTYTFAPAPMGVITAEALAITAMANAKVYDGTTDAAAVPLITSGSLGAGDTANFTEIYNTRNVGTGLILTPRGTVNDGNGGKNYTYTFVPAPTGVITAETLAITAMANAKVYDGTTDAAAVPLITSGSLGAGDTADFTEIYNNRNVGTGLTLTPRGTVNDGNGANNYTYMFVPASTGVITPAALTITATGDTKVYDGTASSSQIPTYGTLYAGDTVTGLTQAFTSKNVLGVSGSTLVVTGDVVNDGDGGKDYTLTTQSATGTITPAALTITATSDTKVYGGTTSSSQIPTHGALFPGDTVTGLAQAFASKNALGANGSTLKVTGYTVNDGDDGHDYAVTTQGASGTITPAVLTITATSDTKVYDGTTSSSKTPTYGTLGGGDTVTGLTQAFTSKNVLGSGSSTLTVTGYTINDGNGGRDYTVMTKTAAATITRAPLFVRANNASTTYGASLPALTDTITGFVGGDNSSVVSGAPMIATTAAPGDNGGVYPITIAAGTLSAANYTITYVPGTLTVILPPPVTATAVALTEKKHDATEITIKFSGPLNAAQAQTIGTYRLATAGKGGSYTAKNVVIIKLRSAVYSFSNGTATVTLTPKKPFTLTKKVQLLVYGSGATGLTDQYGRLIDGNQDGSAGSNATAILSKQGATITATRTNSAVSARAAKAFDVVLEHGHFLSRSRSHATEAAGGTP